MNEKIIFDCDEVDYLQELLNISFGSSAAIISDMLDTFVTLHIPKIELVHIDNIQGYINDSFDISQDYYVFAQQFRGDIEGEALFISKFESMKNLSNAVNEEGVNEDDIQGIIELSSELLNIVNPATIKRMATEINKNVFFSQPSVKSIKSNELVNNTNIINYQTIIVISTVLDFQTEDIEGKLYILLKENTIMLIKQAAADFFNLEEE